MSVLIIIIILVSLLHFIYESILLPTIRLRLRFRLFELRDQIRMLMYKKRCQLDEQAYSYLQDSINASLMVLYRIDIGLIIESYSLFKRDQNLKKRVEKRMETIMQCPLEEFHIINAQVVSCLSYALIANCGGLVLWLFILLVPFVLAKSIYNKAKKFIKDVILDIIFVPENEVQKFRFCSSSLS